MNLNLSHHNGIDRATMLEISDPSNINELTVTSPLSECHPISMDHNRRLVNEMIDYIFDERKGTCEVSSSQCSSVKLQPSEYSYDKRLKYWKEVLKEREKMSLKIHDQTKKEQSDILYNRLSTVDERDKQTVKRLMDYAERLNPTSLSTRKPLVLQEKCDLSRCKFIPEVRETLPQAERKANTVVEISGLSTIAKKELLGKRKRHGCKKPFSWLNSKQLENRIEEIRDDVERVIEYYPDIENLQIVGESVIKSEVNEHNSEIEIMSSNEIRQISTDTIIEGVAYQRQAIVTNHKESIDYGFKINDQVVLMSNKCSSLNFKTVTQFSCLPYETEVKKVFTIENIGSKVLTFEWAHRSFFDKNSTLLKCWDNEFLFDNMPFRLCSGEVHAIFVKFQPRRVNIVKSKWVLKVKPKFFNRKVDGIVMRLSGICAAPPEYVQKLNELQKDVIEKSNKKMINELTTGLIEFAANMPTCTCPYQRSLNEMELFEQLNLGFKCDRYHDLELLKDLYKRAKKPRQKTWDLQINTLKRTILNIAHPETRSIMFNELAGILEPMKGQSVDLETKMSDNPERYRCCFLYVRGIISTAIEEWVDLASTLEETFYQTCLQMLNEEHVTEQENENIFKLLQDESEKHKYILEKHVRKLKPYRDALYMQTYTLLCDFAENIVSIIESTAVI